MMENHVYGECLYVVVRVNRGRGYCFSDVSPTICMSFFWMTVAVDRTQLRDMGTLSHQTSSLTCTVTTPTSSSPCAYGPMSSCRSTTMTSAVTNSALHSEHNTAVSSISDHVSSSHVSTCHADADASHVNGSSIDSNDVMTCRDAATSAAGAADEDHDEVKQEEPDASPQLSPRRRVGHAFPPPVPAHLLAIAQVSHTFLPLIIAHLLAIGQVSHAFLPPGPVHLLAIVQVSHTFLFDLCLYSVHNFTALLLVAQVFITIEYDLQ